MSSNRRRKMRPAGMTLQVKASLPMRDRSCRLVHLRQEAWRSLKCDSSSRKAANLSCGGLACIRLVSSSIPNTVSVVDGPRTFSGLTGAPTVRNKKRVSNRPFRKSDDEALATRKKSSR